MTKRVQDYFSSPELIQPALVHRSYCNEHPGLTSNERLEFLGDSVLGLIISARLFRIYPQTPEGELTTHRSLLVRMTTLAQKAKTLGLDELLLLSKGEQERGGRQNQGLLANTFEAVLGALYLDRGLSACEAYLEDIFPDAEILSYVNVNDPKSLLQEYAQAEGMGTPIYELIESLGPDHARSFVIAVKLGEILAGKGTGPSKQKAEMDAAKSALATHFAHKTPPTSAI